MEYSIKDGWGGDMDEEPLKIGNMYRVESDMDKDGFGNSDDDSGTVMRVEGDGDEAGNV